METTDPSKPLANPRHEIFAQEVANGARQSEAYRSAGYSVKTDSAVWAEASRLVRHHKVAARIAWLEQQGAEKAVLTRAWLIRQAQATYRDAREAQQYAAAAKLLEMLGREARTFIQKAELTGKDGVPLLDLTGLTDAELDDVATLLRKAQAAGDNAGPDQGGEGSTRH